MKRRFFFAMAMLAAVSCYDDSALLERIDALEQALYQKQIDALKASVVSLEEIDAELDSAIKTLRKADTDNNSAQATALTALKTKLEADINALSAQAGNVNETRSWAEATFATLAQYNELMEDLSGLNTLIESEISGVETAITENYTSLTASISETRETIENWVEAALDNYVNNETFQSTADNLRSELNTLSDSLDTLSQRVSTLESALAEMSKTFSVSLSAESLALDAGVSESLTYTVNGSTPETLVKLVCPAGMTASAVSSGESSGTITVTVGNDFVSGELLVLAYDGNGKSSMATVFCFCPVDLSTLGTANCYIVSDTGCYDFSTVKGNGTESVGDVASAVALWESYGTRETPAVGDLVSYVSYKKGRISFMASGRKGNAVIAAKDASGNILWSWHIWLTDQPSDQTYRNGAGKMMDRNLGATSATPGDVRALGLHYQWGRKDPFLSSDGIESYAKAKSTLDPWPNVVGSDATTGTVANAVANPTTFISNNSGKDWHNAGDNNLWASEKTVYDPCPVGYRVPDGGPDGVWATAFGSGSSYPAFDSKNRGYNFGANSGVNYLTTESDCWYPTAGKSSYSDASLSVVGSCGMYWSCTANGTASYLMYVISGGTPVVPSNSLSRANCFSVRCCLE